MFQWVIELIKIMRIQEVTTSLPAQFEDVIMYRSVPNFHELPALVHCRSSHFLAGRIIITP
jgi:hypothetical protein